MHLSADIRLILEFIGSELKVRRDSPHPSSNSPHATLCACYVHPAPCGLLFDWISSEDVTTAHLQSHHDLQGTAQVLRVREPQGVLASLEVVSPFPLPPHQRLTAIITMYTGASLPRSGVSAVVR